MTLGKRTQPRPALRGEMVSPEEMAKSSTALSMGLESRDRAVAGRERRGEWN